MDNNNQMNNNDFNQGNINNNNFNNFNQNNMNSGNFNNFNQNNMNNNNNFNNFNQNNMNNNNFNNFNQDNMNNNNFSSFDRNNMGNNDFNNFNQNNMNSNNYNQNNMDNGFNTSVGQQENNNAFNFLSGGNQNVSGKCKLTLNRKKAFVAGLVSFKIFIDGVEVGKIKNGQTLVFDVTPGQHEITINKCSPTSITINGDTTADVVIYGTNNFGIANISGQGQYIAEVQRKNESMNKNGNQTNILLYTCIGFPVISVIMYYTIKSVIAVWLYGILIGYGIINIFGLKNLKDVDSNLYKSSLIKNIIAIVISVAALVVTAYVTSF